jgi:polyisoprenoid-binding protein YceI
MTEAATQELAGTRWELDPAASSFRFSHKTLWGLVNVKGVFAEASGQGEINPDGVPSGSIHLGAASADTHNTKRDVHLRSADFFDAENHPTIDFTVSSAVRAGSDLQAKGTLTVKGVSAPLDVTAHLDEVSSQRVTLSVETKVDRSQFGLSWNQLGMLRGDTSVSVKAVYLPAQS